MRFRAPNFRVADQQYTIESTQSNRRFVNRSRMIKDILFRAIGGHSRLCWAIKLERRLAK